MSFIINVARQTTEQEKRNGRGEYIHFFKAEVEYGNVKNVYVELFNAFPNCKIDVTQWDTVGHEVDMSKCNF